MKAKSTNSHMATIPSELNAPGQLQTLSPPQPSDIECNACGSVDISAIESTFPSGYSEKTVACMNCGCTTNARYRPNGSLIGVNSKRVKIV